MEEVALSIDSSEPDGHERSRRQWPTAPGRDHHVVAVHQRWLGRSGQRMDKWAVSLLLHSHSNSLFLCLASHLFHPTAEQRHRRLELR